MKKLTIAVSNWNNVNTDLIAELKRRGHNVISEIAEPHKKSFKKIDVIVTWNEVHRNGADVFLQEAKDMGVKTVLVQHGRRGTSRIYPPFNEKLICDKVCLWGENDRKRLTECGNPPERMFVTGTSIFKHLKPRVQHEGINVVFSPEHWGDEVFENNVVASALRKIPGIRVITKVLHYEHNSNQYDNPVASNRNSPDHFRVVAEVLSIADVVVGISESTFELLAEHLDIPVVIADIWVPKACQGDDRYKEYHREYSNACTRVKDMSKFGEAIKYAIQHPEHLREERRQICIDDGGVNIADPVEEIIKVIESK